MSTYSEYPIGPHGLKNAFHREQEDRMDTRIANRAVVTVEVITRAAIIIVMAMFLIAIAGSIYEMLGAAH